MFTKKIIVEGLTKLGCCCNECFNKGLRQGIVQIIIKKYYMY